MAIISVDSEVLEMKMSCMKLAKNLGEILDDYQMHSAKLVDGSVYEGVASGNLETVVQVFGVHLTKLTELYIACAQYLNLVWEEMVKLDEDLASQMYFDFLRENRASHQGEIDALREAYGIEL